MSDFRDIEVKASNQSLIIAIIIGALSLLLLLISFTFEDTYPRFQPIEIAMNFGSTDVGQGETEPQPSETVASSASSNSQAQEVPATTPLSNVATQTTSEERPVATRQPSTQPKRETSTSNAQPASDPQPQGDAKGNSAISSLLGGKGRNPSSGDGSTGQPGNVGDPKGRDSQGTGIGEDWRSRIPEPQRSNCDASGVIIVEIVVDAAGNIKSARPGAKGSTSTDSCLKNKAKALVEKYVRAYPGADGRRGSYRVNLK